MQCLDFSNLTDVGIWCSSEWHDISNHLIDSVSGWSISSFFNCCNRYCQCHGICMLLCMVVQTVCICNYLHLYIALCKHGRCAISYVLIWDVIDHSKFMGTDFVYEAFMSWCGLVVVIVVVAAAVVLFACLFLSDSQIDNAKQWSFTLIIIVNWA